MPRRPPATRLSAATFRTFCTSVVPFGTKRRDSRIRNAHVVTNLPVLVLGRALQGKVSSLQRTVPGCLRVGITCGIERLDDVESHVSQGVAHLVERRNIRKAVARLDPLLYSLVIRVPGVVPGRQAPLVAAEHAAGPQYTPDFGKGPLFIGCMGRGFDLVGGIKARFRSRNPHEIALEKLCSMLESRRPVVGFAFAQLIRIVVESNHVGAELPGNQPHRTAHAATDVQHPHARFEADRLCQEQFVADQGIFK